MATQIICRKPFLLLTVIVGLLPMFIPPTTDAGTELGIQVHWRSDNKNAEQLALALERLYVVLYNTGNFPIREITDQDGRPVETILRSEGLFFGSFFPVGVEAVMCDLNPGNCDRPREKASAEMLQNVANHVGGYNKTRGRWTNKSGSRLKLPDLNFRPYTTLARIPYSTAQSREMLDNVQGADCSQWQVTCTKLVRTLNQGTFDKKRSVPTRPSMVTVPVPGVETELVITGTEGSKTKQALDLLGTPRQMEIALPPRPDQQFSTEWKTQLQNVPSADIGIKALSRHILSTGAVKAQSSFADAHFSDQGELLALIHHPFISADEVPEEYKKPIPVVILDTWFDQEHCELKDKVEMLSPPQHPGSNRTAAGECGAMMSMPPNLADDHGTHVTGIIASAPNDSGVVGLNPYAKVRYVTVDTVSLAEPMYRNLLAQKIVMLAFPPNSTKAANISWQYSNQVARGDPISDSIKALTQSTLFIVAAGNTGEARDQVCGDLPACLSSLDNVITVVGLDRKRDQPRLWREDGRGSNWSQEFNIGAIAEDVLSTTYRNYTGRLSGTSQAAPQVTAAASLLHSVYETHFRIAEPELLPIRVKNRLIYTSDLSNELLHKVQGGRLNVERALDVARDHVVIRKNNALESYAGTLVQFGNDRHNEYIECRLGDSEFIQIKRQDLRRMFFDEHRNKYVIFKNTESGNRDSPLERITNCHLTTRTHNASIDTGDSGEVSFQFRDIRDYVSAMY